MAAHAGLEDDEVVGIARGQGKIADFRKSDGAADIGAARLDDGGATGDFDFGAGGPNFESGVDHGFGAGGERDPSAPLRFKTGLRDRDAVGSGRQFREDAKAVL